MQDEQVEELLTDNDGIGYREHCETLRTCVQSYRYVTTPRPRNSNRMLDYVT